MSFTPPGWPAEPPKFADTGEIVIEPPDWFFDLCTKSSKNMPGSIKSKIFTKSPHYFLIGRIIRSVKEIDLMLAPGIPEEYQKLPENGPMSELQSIDVYFSLSENSGVSIYTVGVEDFRK